MMKSTIFLIFELLLILSNMQIRYALGQANNVLPSLILNDPTEATNATDLNKTLKKLQHLPFIMLIDKDKDNSEYWRETEILSLVHNEENEAKLDLDRCEDNVADKSIVHFPSRRTVRPICKGTVEYMSSTFENFDCRECYETFRAKDRVFRHKHKCPCKSRGKVFTSATRRRKNRLFTSSTAAPKIYAGFYEETYRQLCPQCAHFNNITECELFRDSCKERRVAKSEYSTYCDRKYGKWRTMFMPADYSECRCCDECVFYRELDQSCIADDYSFDTEETLPVRTIDFRAGCNPYWGHPEQEYRALRCDVLLRRCVPVVVPPLPNETIHIRRNYRYEQPTSDDCPISCRGYDCFGGLVDEGICERGAFLPDREQCNCCGRCSSYQQLNQKCAEFKKTVHDVNGTKEIEVEEEFLEPGCDDGLVCRQGRCQDIHTVVSSASARRKRDDASLAAYEPCKRELKLFKKKYGPDGHLHFEAPQCTPLWLYAPVQCRRFVCYCSLEDGTFIIGIKVPRVEVSNMNCDCAREKCRLKSDVECDGYGNYKEASFTPHADDWAESEEEQDTEGKGQPQTTLPPEELSKDYA